MPTNNKSNVHGNQGNKEEQRERSFQSGQTKEASRSDKYASQSGTLDEGTKKASDYETDDEDEQ